MKKRLSALVMAAVLLLSSCSNKAETTTTTTAPEAAIQEVADRVIEGDATGLTPAVWQVTDPESGNSIKMMGTIHLVPETAAIVPQYVMDIYNGCDSIAVEYDVSKVQTDMVVQITYLSYFVLNDGTLITDHLSPETYEKVKARLTELGYYNEAFESYNAAYWENLLTSASIINIEGMKESGVDTYFIGIAKEDGKNVYDIEELEDQMNALTAGSDRLSEYSINEMLECTNEELEEDFMELYNTWATGDTEAYLEYEAEGMEEFPEDIKADYERQNEAMLDKRNIGMAEKAAEYIENGENVFYMVGFAHFCGDGSVIDLLEEQGYTVEKIH